MRPLLSKWKREKSTWPEGAGEGVLVAFLKATSNTPGISAQRYWYATLMEPNCRTLLAGYGTIIS